jgi:flavin reductase (DIM6/NTAB) family NADH-FMN oxidoreductase RutF
MPSADAFQQLVSETDYPMFIVTTVAGATRGGCLVGFVTQASLKPSRLLVCLSKANATFTVAAAAEALAVHFLGEDDVELARLFGEETGDDVDKFARCDWREGPQRLPVLPTKGWVGAAILTRTDNGDHVGFLVEPFAGEVVRPGEAQLSFQEVRDLRPGHPV